MLAAGVANISGRAVWGVFAGFVDPASDRSNRDKGCVLRFSAFHRNVLDKKRGLRNIRRVLRSLVD
jgi:hypothetical protein